MSRLLEQMEMLKQDKDTVETKRENNMEEKNEYRKYYAEGNANGGWKVVRYLVTVEVRKTFANKKEAVDEARRLNKKWKGI